MTIACQPDVAAEAISAIEQVEGRIERVFAEVGGHLGAAHGIFAGLNSGLESLSNELSGAKIEGASVVFQDVATRLRGLAEALPAETALLAAIGASAANASTLLKHLLQHIHLITVIARSSRIEAASLAGNRDDFLSFTREASDLVAAVQSSIVACAKEQQQLAVAIGAALTGQQQFERQYRGQLLSVSDGLISTFSEIKHLQLRGVEVAKLAKAGTSKIGEAVGVAIISLQAGDSTRQRLEHIRAGLRKLAGPDRGLTRSAGPLICLLQAAQLKNTVSEFDADIGKVNRSLAQLSADSIAAVGHGNSLYGGKNDNMASFLAIMKQRLAEASVLISACGQAKAAVDTSIAALEQVLGEFRIAISALGETIVDITLIGMNAGLKAGHLGAKGSTFVVIANELQQTADRISAAAKLLEPVLAEIGRSADSLRSLRSEEKSRELAGLEGSIARAVEEIRHGNGKLLQLMDHLTRESVKFEALMTGAVATMVGLSEKVAVLPTIAGRLEQRHRDLVSPEDAREAGEPFDELYLQYTMGAEREVHIRHCDLFGIPHKPSRSAMDAPKTEAEDVLFF
ncbi:chemotaxis protein [Bradyrhizobium sp.]|uniref:chemotaxis protein n=1 Tax=Bradyrhizobium sp. TaxID=376 RepID=UPI003C1E7311